MRRVRENGEAFEITYHGRVIARIVPVAEAEARARRLADFWREWDQVAAEIGARWPEGVSAEQAIREDRDRL